MKNIPKKTAFTLIEVLIVIAILGIVAAGASFMMNGTRNRVSLEGGQATVLNALERAKNRAATGYGTGNQGVHIENYKVVNFEGDFYAGIGEETPLTGSQTDQSFTDIIFKRLSATSSADITITITNGSGETATISVATSGAIEK